MKSEFEKMRNGELYYFSDPEIQQSLIHAKEVCCKLQTMNIYSENYRETIEDLIPDFPKNSTLCPPFHCDHGNGIRISEGVFINYGCTFLDGAFITIGKHTLILSLIHI